jgi:hypothetical protein
MKVTFERDDEILTFEVANLPAFDIVSKMLKDFDVIKMNGDYASKLFKPKGDVQQPIQEWVAPRPPAALLPINWEPVPIKWEPIPPYVPMSQPYGTMLPGTINTSVMSGSTTQIAGLVDQSTRVDDVEVGEVWHDAQGNDITQRLKALMISSDELTRGISL